MRNALRTILSLVLTVAIVPFLQTAAAKLAEKVGFDQSLSSRWEGSVAFLTDLAHNEWYIFTFGLVLGSCAVLWISLAFPEKKGGKYVETSLKIKLDPAGSRSMLQERAKNIHSWHQSFTQLGTNESPLLHVDTVCIVFEREIDSSRPTIETFGHDIGSYNVYALGKKGAVLQFHDGLQAKLFEIRFPPPDHYKKLAG